MTAMRRYMRVGTVLSALAAILVACGDSDSTNPELTAIHMTGPNCGQSACHEGFTASGTIYDDLAGTTRVPNEVLWVIPPSGPEVGILADGQANFWSLASYQGDYQFRVALGGTTSGLHPMPDRAACNTCHVPVGTDPIAIGRIF